MVSWVVVDFPVETVIRVDGFDLVEQLLGFGRLTLTTEGGGQSPTGVERVWGKFEDSSIQGQRFLVTFEAYQNES